MLAVRGLRVRSALQPSLYTSFLERRSSEEEEKKKARPSEGRRALSTTAAAHSPIARFKKFMSKENIVAPDDYNR